MSEATCRGSIALGSGCKRCSKCRAEMSNIAQAATTAVSLRDDRARPRRVKRRNLEPGYYMVFNSHLGHVAHVRILRGTGGLYVWGLSRYRKVVSYQTLGVRLDDWIVQGENRKAKFYTDRNWSLLFGGE